MEICSTCGGAHYGGGKCKFGPAKEKKPTGLIRNKPVGTSKKKSATESLPELLERAQKTFNAWIRKRDRANDRTTTCISCGLWKSNKDMDAGHFFPSTYSFLRFNVDNVHAECNVCNRMDDNHLEGYKTRLIAKIGLERFKWLEKNRNKKFKWDRAELLTIIEKYK